MHQKEYKVQQLMNFMVPIKDQNKKMQNSDDSNNFNLF